MQLYLSVFPSPVGEILLVTDAKEQVRSLDFVDYEARLHRLLRQHYGAYVLENISPPSGIAAALQRYFEGDFAALERVITATEGTPLQRQVWQALRRIPVGQTKSYGQLASELGLNPRAAIAIGAANGSNPIAIIVPCHRVIASNGELRGYAGGLHRKRWLLEHESAIPIQASAPQAQLFPAL